MLCYHNVTWPPSVPVPIIQGSLISQWNIGVSPTEIKIERKKYKRKCTSLCGSTFMSYDIHSSPNERYVFCKVTDLVTYEICPNLDFAINIFNVWPRIITPEGITSGLIYPHCRSWRQKLEIARALCLPRNPIHPLKYLWSIPPLPSHKNISYLS